MEAFSKFVAISLLAFSVFVVSAMQTSDKLDTIVQSYVEKETVDFVENVKKQGRITINMYNDFVDTLAGTGNVYDIDMLHSHEVVNPKFSVSGDTITTATYDDNYYTDDILACIFNKDGEGEYRMNKGDYFSIVVKNRNVTSATRMRSIVYGSEFPSCTIYVPYGGEIADENY